MILSLPLLLQLAFHFSVLPFFLPRLMIIFFTFRYISVTLLLHFPVCFVSKSALPYTSTSVSSSALFLLLGLLPVLRPLALLLSFVFFLYFFPSFGLFSFVGCFGGLGTRASSN